MSREDFDPISYAMGKVSGKTGKEIADGGVIKLGGDGLQAKYVTMVFDGTETWSKYSSAARTGCNCYYTPIPSAVTLKAVSASTLKDTVMICNILGKPSSIMHIYDPEEDTCWYTTSAGQVRVVVSKQTYADKDAWEAHLQALAAAGTPMTLTAELATGETYSVET